MATPSGTGRETENVRRLAAVPSLRCITTGSSALTTAQSPAFWLAKMRALAAAYDSTVGWRSRWSSARFSHSAIHGRKRRRRLELEAARLDHVHGVRRGRVHLRAERHADVAADQHAASVRRQHPADQRGRRRLALRAGDGDDAALQPARRQLELADDLDAARPRVVEHRLLERHARADDDQVGVRQRPGLVAAELEANAGGPQSPGLVEGGARSRSASRAHLAGRAAPPPRRRCAPRRPRPPGARPPKVARLHTITAASTS